VKTALQKFHFIGICGTAMGSVAAALRQRGFKVSGSDENVYPPMSIFLEQHGIKFLPRYPRIPEMISLCCHEEQLAFHVIYPTSDRVASQTLLKPCGTLGTRN